MTAIGTAVIYLVLGAVVAAALLLREEQAAPSRKAALALGALLFWPLLAPFLASGPVAGKSPRKPAVVRLGVLPAELLASLEHLPPLAEEMLAPELARIRGLEGATGRMSQRLREMDALLATAEFDRSAAQAALSALEGRHVADSDPRVQSVRARLRNIDRLQTMRTRTGDNLERVVLKLEEMSSQLQLLRFAGGGDAEAVHLLKEIAGSVADISEGLLSEEATAPRSVA
jgi:hypothetical protein